MADMLRNSLKLTTMSWELLTANIISTLNVLWSVYIIRLSRRPGKDSDLPSIFGVNTYVVKRISKGMTRRNKKLNCRNREDSKESMNDDERELSCSTRKENYDFEEEKHK